MIRYNNVSIYLYCLLMPHYYEQHCVAVAVCTGRSALPGLPPPTFATVTVQWLLSQLEGLQKPYHPSLLSEWKLHEHKQLHP